MFSRDLVRHSSPRAIVPLNQAMSQLFRDAFASPFDLGAAASSYRLGLNLYEKDDNYILQVPLPGVKPDQYKIMARDNVVTLQGSSDFSSPDGAKPLFQGAGGFEFREQVVLPGDVDAEKVTAHSQDGILTLTLPKAKHARERTIKVHHQGQTASIEAGGNGARQQMSSTGSASEKVGAGRQTS